MPNWEVVDRQRITEVMQRVNDKTNSVQDMDYLFDVFAQVQGVRLDRNCGSCVVSVVKTFNNKLREWT